MNTANWTNVAKLFTKHWDKLKNSLRIDSQLKDNPEVFLELVKNSCSNILQDNTYQINDTITNVKQLIKKTNPENRATMMLDIYKNFSKHTDKKKTDSEVFTNIGGFTEALRKAYRRNPRPFLNMDSKFLEVSFGTGICFTAMLSFLMDTLVSDAALTYGTGKRARALSEDDLRKHILDHMLYGCELQAIFIPITLHILDPNQTSVNLPKHLITGDSLEVSDWTFGGDVPNGKFDVVFGNPPYNETSKKYRYFKEAWANAKEAKALHLAFTRLAVDLLKVKGLLIYITRASVCVNDTAQDFRTSVLLKYFDILNIWIPQAGTLFDNAQTTGMVLIAQFDPERTENSDTIFERYMNNQDHQCRYRLEKNTNIIPLLWHENTVTIYNQYKNLENLFESQKGIKPDGVVVKKNGKPVTFINDKGEEIEQRSNDPKDPNGIHPFLVKLNKNEKEESKTNVDRIRKTIFDRKTEVLDPKLLCPSGCSDASGSQVKWLENIFEDVNGEYVYSDNIVATALQGNHTTDSLRKCLEHPISQVYGSLFRIDRNTSAAFYRHFSYDMKPESFEDHVQLWAKKQI